MAAFTPGQKPELNDTAKGIILNGIIQKLIDLNLSGIGGRWYFMRQPWLSKIGAYPAGCVSEFRGYVDDQQGVVGQADTTFRYLVAMARGSNFDLQNGAEVMLGWDQTVRRAFRKQQPDWLGDVTGVRTVRMTIAEGESFVDEAFRKGVDAMFFLVDYQVREALA